MGFLMWLFPVLGGVVLTTGLAFWKEDGFPPLSMLFSTLVVFIVASAVYSGYRGPGYKMTRLEVFTVFRNCSIREY
jgi:hypothetical protein